MLITISNAAQLPGAPPQPSISRMTHNRVLPSFLKKTDAGWRVDTDDPAWGNLLAARRGQSPAANAAKREGPRLAGRMKKTRRPPSSEDADSEDAEREENVRKAIESKIIFNAKREKLKMMQDEIKTNAMKDLFVERSEGEYWLSFIQRGIIDSFSAIDRCFAETRRLILLGNDIEGRQYLKNELKAAFERAAQNMKEAVEGETGE
jgi:hypothetical protein